MERLTTEHLAGGGGGGGGSGCSGSGGGGGGSGGSGGGASSQGSDAQQLQLQRQRQLRRTSSPAPLAEMFGAHSATGIGDEESKAGSKLSKSKRHVSRREKLELEQQLLEFLEVRGHYAAGQRQYREEQALLMQEQQVTTELGGSNPFRGEI